MRAEIPFGTLIECVRARDQTACSKLYQDVEPDLSRIVNRYLRLLGFSPMLDAEDITQMVLVNLFARLSDGQFEIQTRPQLRSLLARMARNQVLDEARRLWASRRSAQKQMRGKDAEAAILLQASNDPTPSRIVAGFELLEEMHRRLDPVERLIADRRYEGVDWLSIAKEIGSTPEATRKRLSRAYERIIRELQMQDMLPR